MKNNVFDINENVSFNFVSKGKQYLMSLNIIEGLVVLYEVKEDKLEMTQTMFISDVYKSYEVEAKPVEEVKQIEEVKKKSVKKKRKKKK